CVVFIMTTCSIQVKFKSETSSILIKREQTTEEVINLISKQLSLDTQQQYCLYYPATNLWLKEAQTMASCGIKDDVIFVTLPFSNFSSGLPRIKTQKGYSTVICLLFKWEN